MPFIFVSLIFIVFGIALGFFSPNKKIWWYGYRTPQSMKSDASYVFANRISGRILISLGLLIFTTSAILEPYLTKLIIFTGLVFLFTFTEWKLYQYHKDLD
ncbi:MAG: SdpI family protein [Chitinophagales bacterium]|jgi:uncharacterized membrane protein|nr:SdpI family protein [Sphingobacteriales bacterium]